MSLVNAVHSQAIASWLHIMCARNCLHITSNHKVAYCHLYYFLLYADDVVNTLRAHRAGCFIDNVFVGCITYADDLLLVSSSVDVLQKMVNLCSIEAKYLDMKFNSKKSLILRFGAHYNKREIQVNLVSERILVVDRAKYLGVYLES